VPPHNLPPVSYVSNRSHLLSGVTLIELILVIAVIGVLSTAGILFYQQRMQNQKIEKTVSQMEQWMQAGMAYYVRNKAWPNNAEELMPDYLPNGSNSSNPWCNTGTCYRVAPVGGFPDSSAFAVTATIQAAQGIADAIAVRLPYGVRQGEGELHSVTATVNIPLSQSKKNDADMILVNVFPFQLLGKNSGGTSDFEISPQGPQKKEEFITTGEGVCIKTPGSSACIEAVPDCAKLYNADYTLGGMSVITTAYQADQKGATQQPAFSVLSVEAVRGEKNKNNIFIRANVRPQTYYSILDRRWWSCALAPCRFAVGVEMNASLMDAIDIQGRVFVFCKKSPTSSVSSGSSGHRSSQPLSTPSSSSDFRF
jgi:prepilin-type N-terminal cleavage/methylation domain-containing protein